MAGSKSKSGVKTRGGGIQRRGGGGGRSSAGTSTGALEALATVATVKPSATGGSQIRSSTDNRAQVDGASRRDKGTGIDGGGRSSHIDGGELSPLGRKGLNSSHDSNRSARRSPTSQETPQSAGNVSVSRTLPLQYTAASNRFQPQPTLRRPNLNLNLQHQQRLQVQTQVHEEEGEEEEEEEENVDGEEDLDLNPDDIEPEDEGDEGNGEDEDYEQLLADILADPQRQRLPLLSEQPVPDSIW